MSYPANRAVKSREGMKHFFLVTSFWSGITVMAFELVGARLLMPIFGMGIQIWTIVIATSLAALAIGYCFGGKIVDAHPSVTTLAVVLLLATLSLIFVMVLGSNIPALFENMSVVTGAFCSAISIISGPLLLLGMVQPVLARLLIRTADRTGTIVGSLMAAGTTGGIFGTALTGLLLIPYLGLSKTLFILTVGTLVTAIIALIYTHRWTIIVGAIIISAPAIVVGWTPEQPPQSIGVMRVLEEVEGLYGHLEALEYRGTHALICNGIFQTVMPTFGLSIVRGTLILGRDYIELIPYFRPEARIGLLIGVGAGLYHRILMLYGIEVRGVEIEPAAVLLAEKYFDLAAEVDIMDGRAFLVRDKKQYDVVIIDAFLGGIPSEHLFTKEAFELVDEHLNQDGVIVVRLIGYPEQPAIKAVARTLQNVFPYIVALQSGVANELQGIFIFASRADLELGGGGRLELSRYGFTGEEFCDINTHNAALLTDDKSNLALLGNELVAEHRYNSLKLRGEPLW